MLTCQKCGYKWEPRIKDPKCCPECKSRSWINKVTPKVAKPEPPEVTGKPPKELVRNPIKTQEDAKAAIEKLDKPKRAMITTKGGKMNSAGKMYTGEKVTYAGKPAWVVRDVNGRESMTFEAPPEG